MPAQPEAQLVQGADEVAADVRDFREERRVRFRKADFRSSISLLLPILVRIGAQVDAEPVALVGRTSMVDLTASPSTCLLSI